MTRPDSRHATLGLLLTAAGGILFASKGLFSKALHQEGVDYQTVTAMRALLALPMFAVLGIWRGGLGSPVRPSRRTLALAALAGVLCYAIGATVDFRALELIDISLERALLFTYPALIVAWKSLRSRRWPHPWMLAALALTYAGIVLVVGAFDGAWRANLGGSLLVLGCATTTAAYFLLGERCIPELGSAGFTIVAMTSAAIAVCANFALTHPLSDMTSLTSMQWLLLLALAALCMFLPTLLQAEGIRLVGAERGGLAGTIGPPAAMLLGVLLLDERPTAWQVAGTLLVLSGILLIARQPAIARAGDVSR